MEVDFPECATCGKRIFEGGKFFDISIRLSKLTVDNCGGAGGISTGNSGNPLRICENCFSKDSCDGMAPLVKLKIILELERQKRELEPKKKQEGIL